MTSPMGMAIPANLPPAAAAALLPPQSAAMAAYLGVAAAAAQQNRLFLNSAAASLSSMGVDNPAALLAPGLGPILDFSGKRSPSSSGGSNKSSSDHHHHRDNNDKSINSDDEGHGDPEMDVDDEDVDDMDDEEENRGGRDNDDDNGGVVNLSHKSSSSSAAKRSMLMRRQQQQHRMGSSGANNGSNNSPLDLTMSRKRSAIDNLALLSAAGGNQSLPLHHLAAAAQQQQQRHHSPQSPGAAGGLPRKLSRLMPDYKQWPFGAAANASAAFFANSLASPKGSENAWNGQAKMNKMMSATSDATKALEKMSEMSRLGGGGNDRNSVSPTGPAGYAGSKNSPMHMNQSSSGRHSAWQSHWLNKGADSAKDVLKCVWCKQSFTSLAALTTHMKETKHCGVNMPPNANAQNPSQNNHNQAQRDNHHHHNQGRDSSGRGGGGGDRDSGGSKSDLNLLIKETMPLPRKLVRGQDVWLGKGAEQTRQILKCMWCGQSFRSLAEMTSHMQQTQHYTNIISQEQIISWKSDDGKTGGPSGTPAAAAASGAATAPSAAAGSSERTPQNERGPPTGPHHNAHNAQTNSTVSAVLTCKVCDQAFSSLKDLSNHMVKNSHYKEHIMRSITESGSRRRQTREKRKKSLPVRKLLELERAQHDYKNGTEMPSAAAVMSKTMREAASGRITCEKCGDKIDTALFVDHIRQCVGGVPMPPSSSLKSSGGGGAISPMSSRDGRKSSSTINDEMVSPGSRLISPQQHGGSPKEGCESSSEKNSSPSVLNALEQLIEKSFDTRSRHSGPGNSGGGGHSSGPASQPSTPLGASILKRLGIDESVDYTKPLIDTQTMNLLRSYQQQQHHQQMYAAAAAGRGRERSGSESSSFSDRTNSRMESLTPDRKYESMSAHSMNSRNSPDRKRDSSEDKEDSLPLHRIKREIIEERMVEKRESQRDRSTDTPVKVKTEVADDDVETKSQQGGEEKITKKPASISSPACSPRRTPVGTPMASPAPSDRSTTPRSVASHDGGVVGSGGSGSKPKSHMSASSSSLGALSSMFDNLTGNAASGGHEGEAKEGARSGKKGPSHNPLAALQKLCDKTETNPARSNSNSNPMAAMANQSVAMTASGSGSNGNSAGGSGLLAFSWACNDAVMTADSIIKCAFCDTPFISKGAYRHHLSKMHFIKDDGMPDAAAMKSSHRSTPNTPAIAKSPTPPAQSPKSANGMGSSAQPLTTSNNSNRSPTPTSTSTTPTPSGTASGPGFEESPHSKFLKYTELAKQLSSKYV